MIYLHLESCVCSSGAIAWRHQFSSGTLGPGDHHIGRAVLVFCFCYQSETEAGDYRACVYTTAYLEPAAGIGCFAGC